MYREVFCNDSITYLFVMKNNMSPIIKIWKLVTKDYRDYV